MSESKEQSGNGIGADGIVGKLEESENKALWSLRKAADDVVREVGQLEVRKARLLGSLGQIEERAQKILNGAASRLNIPEGQVWHASPDGTVRLGAGGPASSQES